MQLWELFLIAVGLSADAFAVAVCKGLSVKKLSYNQSVITGLYFGGFQALMPLIGYWLGCRFQSLITSVDHWIAFALLALIGINMIREARDEAESFNDSFKFSAMLPLAVATSIDALAIGITFACLNVNIVGAVSMIGITTFVLSGVGIWLGNRFGAKYRSKAECFGGIILILIGAKILFEHLGMLG